MGQHKDTQHIAPEEAYAQSVALLQECISPHGFLASPTKKDNYRRVFSRDSGVIGLAALATDDDRLVEGVKNSICTLAKYQGEHGEIPSNVEGESGDVSYGGTAGRVDATLWFVIIAVAYAKHTGERHFLEKMIPHIHQAVWLLGAWEFNLKGLIYVPPTGDWADEYLQEGYKLYDQVLYYKALRSYAQALEILGEDAGRWHKKSAHLLGLIRSNFGMCAGEDDAYSYHPVLRESGLSFCSADRKYWMPYFTPFGYGHRFASLANILISLADIASDEERELVNEHIKTIGREEAYVLPAFHPVIEKTNKDWSELQTSFTFSFKNKPYEYHNGGLWPMVTGFYVLDLARQGNREHAAKYLDGINAANYKGQDNETWGFYEFLHGKTLLPMGTKHQGWSAAAGVIGYHALKNPDKILF